MRALESGYWAILPTPFHNDSLSVDAESLERVVAHYRSVGAQGLVALGVFGEAASLTDAESAIVLRTIRQAGGETPLAVGVAAKTPGEIDRQVKAFRQIVTDGDLTVMVKLFTEDVHEQVSLLNRLHERYDVGVILQDYPVNTGVLTEPGQVAYIVANSPNVRAVKAEAPPTSLNIAHLVGRVDVPVFGGLGGLNLLDELACGSSGAMTGFSYPEAIMLTLQAYEAGGLDEAAQVTGNWLPIINFEGQPSIMLQVRKALLKARGLIAEGKARPPTAQLDSVLLPLVARYAKLAQDLMSK